MSRAKKSTISCESIGSDSRLPQTKPPLLESLVWETLEIIEVQMIEVLSDLSCFNTQDFSHVNFISQNLLYGSYGSVTKLRQIMKIEQKTGFSGP